MNKPVDCRLCNDSGMVFTNDLACAGWKYCQCSVGQLMIANAGTNPFAKNDTVDHPKHYTAHPSGIECIQVTEHMGFNVGNAVKYLWRAGLKGSELEDLKKARWYIDREIQRLGKV